MRTGTSLVSQARQHQAWQDLRWVFGAPSLCKLLLVNRHTGNKLMSHVSGGPESVIWRVVAALFVCVLHEASSLQY